MQLLSRKQRLQMLVHLCDVLHDKSNGFRWLGAPTGLCRSESLRQLIGVSPQPFLKNGNKLLLEFRLVPFVIGVRSVDLYRYARGG